MFPFGAERHHLVLPTILPRITAHLTRSDYHVPAFLQCLPHTCPTPQVAVRTIPGFLATLTLTKCQHKNLRGLKPWDPALWTALGRKLLRQLRQLLNTSAATAVKDSIGQAV